MMKNNKWRHDKIQRCLRYIIQYLFNIINIKKTKGHYYPWTYTAPPESIEKGNSVMEQTEIKVLLNTVMKVNSTSWPPHTEVTISTLVSKFHNKNNKINIGRELMSLPLTTRETKQKNNHKCANNTLTNVRMLWLPTWVIEEHKVDVTINRTRSNHKTKDIWPIKSDNQTEPVNVIIPDFCLRFK